MTAQTHLIPTQTTPSSLPRPRTLTSFLDTSNHEIEAHPFSFQPLPFILSLEGHFFAKTGGVINSVFQIPSLSLPISQPCNLQSCQRSNTPHSTARTRALRQIGT